MKEPSPVVKKEEETVGSSDDLLVLGSRDVLGHLGPPDARGGGFPRVKTGGGSGAPHSLSCSPANRCQPSRP